MDLSGFGIFHKLPKLKFGHEIWNNDDLQVFGGVVLFISTNWHPLPNPQAATLLQVIFHHLLWGCTFHLMAKNNLDGGASLVGGFCCSIISSIARIRRI